MGSNQAGGVVGMKLISSHKYIKNTSAWLFLIYSFLSVYAQ